jgi:hypothetical protein
LIPDPIDEMTEEEVPNDSLADVVLSCGMDVARSLMRHLRGLTLTVPLSGLSRVQEAAEKAGRVKGPYLAEDLPSDHWRSVAEYCGMEVVLSLFKNLGDISIVIPTNPFYRMLHRYIVKHLEPGKNEYEIILRLGISRSLFYRTLEEKQGPEKHPSNHLQTSLF